MAKMCHEELEIESGEKIHCGRYDPQHSVHEYTGSKAEMISKNVVLIKRFTIQWTVTEMEIE